MNNIIVRPLVTGSIKIFLIMKNFTWFFLLFTELPDVIREMRKEQALYKSRKNTTKGGQRENQVRMCMHEGRSAIYNDVIC